MNIPDEVLGYAVYDQSEQLVREDCGQGGCVVLPVWVLSLIVREKHKSYDEGASELQAQLKSLLAI